MSSFLFVASLFEDQPMLVDISGSVPKKRKLPSTPRRQRMEGEEINEKQAAQDAKQTTCVTIFTALGNHIIAGTSKGWLNVLETETCSIIHSHKLCTGVIILLRLTPSGRDMVCNASDRVIRTIPVPDLASVGLNVDDIAIEVEHKFQDVVNRLSWNHVSFSSTGEYVCATTYMNHDIYVWERGHGSLVKILEGPREELGVVEVCDHCIIYTIGAELIAASGIRIDHLLQPAALSQGESTSGRLLRPSVGQLLRPILPKSKRMWSTLSVKTNLTFTRSRRSISAAWILRTKPSIP